MSNSKEIIVLQDKTSSSTASSARGQQQQSNETKHQAQTKDSTRVVEVDEALLLQEARKLGITLAFVLIEKELSALSMVPSAQPTTRSRLARCGVPGCEECFRSRKLASEHFLKQHSLQQLPLANGTNFIAHTTRFISGNMLRFEIQKRLVARRYKVEFCFLCTDEFARWLVGPSAKVTYVDVVERVFNWEVWKVDDWCFVLGERWFRREHKCFIAEVFTSMGPIKLKLTKKLTGSPNERTACCSLHVQFFCQFTRKPVIRASQPTQNANNNK